MRKAGLAIVAAVALAACGQGGPGQSADSGGGASIFPDLSRASYRMEATVTHEAGAMPVVLMRDGARQRMEMQTPDGMTTVIANTETGENFVITTAGGQTMAMRMELGDFEDPAKEWSGELATTARHTGSCSAAGEQGSEWTHGADGATNTVCVTSDGVILRSTKDGRTVWETTSIERGPQSAELFTVPAGVQVMDLGDMGAAMEQALDEARRQAGQ